jgi:hypothetical protein
MAPVKQVEPLQSVSPSSNPSSVNASVPPFGTLPTVKMPPVSAAPELAPPLEPEDEALDPELPPLPEPEEGDGHSLVGASLGAPSVVSPAGEEPTPHAAPASTHATSSRCLRATVVSIGARYGDAFMHSA